MYNHAKCPCEKQEWPGSTDADQTHHMHCHSIPQTPRFVTTNKQVLLRRLCFSLKGFLLPLIPLCVYLYVLFQVLYLLYIYIICLHYIWQCINYIYRTITYRYSEYLRLYFVSFLHRISYITGISYVFWHIACNIYMYFMISYIYILTMFKHMCMYIVNDIKPFFYHL